MKTITARYAGTCASTGARILPGDVIQWSKGRVAFCPTPSPRELQNLRRWLVSHSYAPFQIRTMRRCASRRVLGRYWLSVVISPSRRALANRFDTI